MPPTTPYPHPAALDAQAIFAECEIETLRRSGPGGQHRNKVETAVQLRHRPTDVAAEANERRSQAENRTAALFRLRVNLALEMRGRPAAGHAPSGLWTARSRQGRLDVAETHADFPALLAEALDALAVAGADPAVAAQRLGVTPSQLVKLLKKEPRALALLNAWRADRGLHRLQ